MPIGLTVLCSDSLINGLSGYMSLVAENLTVQDAKLVHVKPIIGQDGRVQLQFPEMRPGDVVVLEMALGEEADKMLQQVCVSSGSRYSAHHKQQL